VTILAGVHWVPGIRSERADVNCSQCAPWWRSGSSFTHASHVAQFVDSCKGASIGSFARVPGPPPPPPHGSKQFGCTSQLHQSAVNKKHGKKTRNKQTSIVARRVHQRVQEAEADSTASTGERQLNLRRGSQALEPMDAGVCFWLSGDTKHPYPPTKVQQRPSNPAANPTRQLYSPYKIRTVAFEVTVLGSNARFSARVGKNFLFLTSTLSSDGDSSNGVGSCSDRAGKRQAATFFVSASLSLKG
jgi:hypothetical protein